MEDKNILTEEQVEEKLREENEGQDSKDLKEDTQQKDTYKKSTSPKKSKIEKLRRENEQLEKELAALRDANLRLGAEFQNLRKRLNREKEEVVLYANEKLLENILPILDDFERSLSAENNSMETFRKGIELIYKNFLEVLEKEGVKPIKAVGEPFDHNLHDALMMTEKEGVESGTIVEEVMKGYYYKDKVLRHAKVIVAK